MSGRYRVLLLNPPADRVVFRDNYHSLEGKGGYIWQPDDLLIQSGFLMRDSEVALVDAVADRLDYRAALDRAAAEAPDAVFALMGELTRDQDAFFLSRLKARLPHSKLVAAGDLFQFATEITWADYPYLDGVLTYLMAPTLGAFFRDGLAPHVRTPAADAVAPTPGHCFTYPPPRLDLFIHPRYRLAFYGRQVFHSIAVSLGCPYRCRFCIVPRFPLQLREPDNLREELVSVRRTGCRHLYVRDACFGFDRRHTTDFLEMLIGWGSPFRWNCFTRADLLEPATLALMKRAGCFLVQLGVESPDDRVLAQEKKNLDLARIAQAFDSCRKMGILASAHFVLGLHPDDARQGQQFHAATRRLHPDFVSYNVLFGRHGLDEDVRRKAAEVRADACLIDLQRRLHWRFYLSPAFVWNLPRLLRHPHLLRGLAGLAHGFLTATNGATLNKDAVVSVARCRSYAAAEIDLALRRLIEPFGGPAGLFNPGERVLIKPNLLRGAAPDTAVCTHPEVLSACIRLVRDVGAVPVVGDLPSIQEGSRRLAAPDLSGLREACDREGIAWTDLAADGFEAVVLPSGLTVRLSKTARQVDAVLSLAKVKTHFYTGMTGVIKNLFGCVAPADRRLLHARLSYRQFLELLVDVAGALPLRFGILDGVTGMEGLGPGNGRPRQLGLLLGAADPAALDRLAERVTGLDGASRLLLQSATAAGLGQNHDGRILVVGENPSAVRIRFRPALFGFTRLLHPFAKRYFSAFSLRPKVNVAVCAGVGDCVRACPTGAIRLVQGRAVIDEKLCVACFNCRATCPHSAIDEFSGAATRLFLRLRNLLDRGQRRTSHTE